MNANGIGASCSMTLSVVCLCAEWCGTCREFYPKFHQWAQQEVSQRFFWLDIEAHEHLLEDVEIETFPTILIANKGDICFFGAIPPHLDMLQRLYAAAKSGGMGTIHDESLKSLVKNLQLLFQVNISADGTFRTPP